MICGVQRRLTCWTQQDIRVYLMDPINFHAHLRVL